MNPAIVNMMPNPFVKLFAKPYVAGSSVADAISTARQLHAERRIAATLDVLGEAASDEAQIQTALELYRRTIDAIVDAGAAGAFSSGQRRPSVSLKPSTFTVTHRDAKGDLAATTDRVRCHENIADLVRYAAERDVALTIDMEDHAWVDFTLGCYQKLLDEGLTNVGTVLQSMLFRTRDDVQRFDARARVRLVIGIYREPASIAHTAKRDMKRRLVEHAEALLDRGVLVEFATHDEEYLFRFLKEVVVARGIGPDRFEVQMLLGVPRTRVQDQLVDGSYFQRPELGDTAALEPLRKGVLTRLYVPFAIGWDQALAYCKRRLNENPNIVWYGIKNLVVGG